MKGITIYCGSAAGRLPEYEAAAAAVGAAIARAGVSLIYGGGSMGLMGAAGRACRAAGGATVAIIPQFMVERGWNDPESTHTIVTPDMHRRKERMAAEAVGVIAMPGGVGTFEELMEIITWRQLGLFHGNIVILNVAGYYDSLLAQLNDAMSAGFLPSAHGCLWHVASDPEDAVRAALNDDEELNLPPKF